MDTDFLDWALADFSGYVAADELYDGPFCILSAVDNRRYKRILYDVLDHDPTHDDIRAFLGRLKMALAARDLTLFGVTTDGSALSPEPLREVFGDVPHQICTFHMVAEVVKAVLGAVASARKGLAAKQPTLRKGRPSTPAAKQAARTKKRLEVQRAGLFTHRYLFVQRHLNNTERKTLWRITRDLPQLRTLRALMEQVYALFDRRCRTHTALAKLATLRRRLLRFTQVGETLKKLFSPTLEKALTFLDDKLLPSTSNAVERGNRRYRKMQKQVYRVRTQAQISARLALDMWREAQGAGRHQTLHTLHEARAA
jgi:phage tail protein X